MTGSTDLDIARMWEEGLQPDSLESREARMELARDERARRNSSVEARGRILDDALTFVLTGLFVMFALGGVALASGREWSGWELLLIPGIPMALVAIVLVVNGAHSLIERETGRRRANPTPARSEGEG